MCWAFGDTIKSWEDTEESQTQRASGKPGPYFTLHDHPVSLSQLSPLLGLSGLKGSEGAGQWWLLERCVFVSMDREDFYLLLAPVVVGRVLLLLGGW